MRRNFTIQARSVEKIVKFAAAQGVTINRLYEAVRLDPAILSDPDSRIHFSQLVALYETAAQLSGDDNFGLHLGETVDPKVFDVVGYSALSSSTLGDAFARVGRYHSIWTDGATFTLEQSQPTSAIAYKYVDETIREHRQDSEMTFATVATLCRAVADPSWSPLKVEFQHSTPVDTSEHVKLFRCPVKFGVAANRLVFQTSSLSLPIATADSQLCAVLERHAEELLARFPPRDKLIDQVRSMIGAELNGGDPSLERIAVRMGLSARTLQRKLQELGATHNELVDQMRHELAMRYLREREVAICEVAYLLGFSEASSFHRAFKRWTGVTPKEFRG